MANSFRCFMKDFEGREQSLKLLQYASFLASVLWNSQTLRKRAKKLALNLAVVRKALRLGMPFKNLLEILTRAWNKPKTWTRGLSDVFGVAFYLADHCLYFQRVGLLKLQPESTRLMLFDIVRNLSWVLKELFAILATALEMHNLQKLMQKLVRVIQRDSNQALNSTEYRNLGVKNDLLVLEMIRSILDIPVAIYFLDKNKLNAGVVGVLGVLSSAVGVARSFKKQTLT